ncbi:Cu_bind_like domain-containing protein [Cephalotus follicularis]|uniref:Cu_bind_like domain-containing protein n=1 Tax=Cephalotus follicularis TaxID=3775 RepID=A0A1Q3CSP5_CEPFO|nr:Cu_bind_like domain-containing protein [Cephalotus follicularis]
MSGFGAGFICVTLILCMVVPGLATVYTVGDSSGWTLGADYTTWASDKTFEVGDSLVFNYDSSHTVDEVSASDYKACTSANAITTDTSGKTTIDLKTAGTHYFICGVMSHCAGGMKLAVTVGTGSTTNPSKTPTTTTPSSQTPKVGTTPTVTRSDSITLSPLVALVITFVAFCLLSV